MAIDETYLCAEAIAEIRAALRPSGSPAPPNKPVVLTMIDVLFIFGLEDKPEDGINQGHLQDAYDWFIAKIGVWPELANVTLSWVRQKVMLHPS